MIKQLTCVFLCITSIHYLACMDTGATPPSHMLATTCATEAECIAQTTDELARTVASLVQHACLLQKQLSAEEEQHEEKASGQGIAQSNSVLKSLLSPPHSALFRSAARLKRLSNDIHTTALQLRHAELPSWLPPKMMEESAWFENSQVVHAEFSATESNDSSDFDSTSSDESLPPIMTMSTPPKTRQIPYIEHPKENDNCSNHTDGSDNNTSSGSLVQPITINNNIRYTAQRTNVHFLINISAINTVPLPENSAVSQLTRQRRNSI